LRQTFDASNERIIRRVSTPASTYETTLENLADAALGAESAWWQSVLRGSRVELPTGAKPLTVVDAFCGSGGLALGLSAAAEALHRNARFAAIIDTDAAALRVHRHNLGAKKALAESVTTLVDYHVRQSGNDLRFGYAPEVISAELSSITDVDVLIAGPPCQGHSNLNNHTRRQDPRNELYVTTVALAVALKAKAVLIENVPTVQNAYSDVVAAATALLRSEGYGVSTAVLKADDFGAAQRRSRFFILAVRGLDIDEDFLGEASLPFRAPSQPLSWAIGDLLHNERNSLWNTPPEVTPINQARIDYLFDNELFDLPDAQRPDCHKNGTTYTSVYGRMHWDRPAQTITTGFGTPGQGRYVHPSQRRVITPHEAARIQGYPDWFDFEPQGLPLKRKNLSKWIGDAVHPLLGYVSGMITMGALMEAQRRDRIAA
jgi:DNA (cytosine-5)-methyltransferase 1